MAWIQKFRNAYRNPRLISTATFSSCRDPSKDEYMSGVPRKLVISTVANLATTVTSFLNSTTVQNVDTLKELIHNRPKGTPLLTVGNHISCLDDPLMWGIRGLQCSNPKYCRWTLTAKDICFTNPYFSHFFRLGKCIPIDRFGSIHQECMAEAVEVLNRGEWLHTFPEGKIDQDRQPIRRLKWGVASIIDRCSIPPIILCIGISGFENVLPEKHLFGKRAMLPLWGKKISVVVGEPFQIDVPLLKKEASEAIQTGNKQFGSDCFLELASSTGIDGGESEEEAKLKQVQEMKEKEEKIQAVGDELTRRTYSELMSRIHARLQKLVLQAHASS